MADDKKKRDFRDRTRINVNEDYELQYWSEELGVSKEEVREAVEKVGESVERVREFVAKD